jgi:hypothetical protein
VTLITLGAETSILTYAVAGITFVLFFLGDEVRMRCRDLLLSAIKEKIVTKLFQKKLNIAKFLPVTICILCWLMLRYFGYCFLSKPVPKFCEFENSLMGTVS